MVTQDSSTRLSPTSPTKQNVLTTPSFGQMTLTLRNRHMKAAKRWSEHTKRLSPLAVGDHVRIQNQTGPYPTKWDKTGRVIEVRQFDQYIIRIDGSSRMTTRNRKLMRKYLPVQTMPP